MLSVDQLDERVRKMYGMTPEEILKHFGKRLRKIREGYGMTQKELAKEMGYRHNTSISEVELGEKYPSSKFIFKILGFFDALLSYYFPSGELDELIEKVFSKPGARPLLEKCSRLKKEYRHTLENLADRFIEIQNKSNES